jgi:hypothetical protein
MAEPVALGIKPPQAMTLGDMINIARGAQAYKQAEIINPLEAQKAGAEAQLATGTVKPRISKSLSEADKARIETFNAEYGLNDKEQEAFSKILGGFSGDARLKPENIKANPLDVVKLIHEMKAQGKAGGIRDEHLDMLVAPVMTKAMQTPDAVPQYLENIKMKGMSAEQQRAAGLERVETTPSGQVIRVKPSLYGEKPQVSFERPTGEVPANETIETDAFNNKTIVKRDTSGKIISSRPVPSGTQSGGFQSLPQGETPDTVAKARAEQLAVQNAAKGVQSSQYNNNTIINLADKALVGSNAETLAKLGGGFAVLNAVGSDSFTAVDNRQKLGHALSQETLNLSSSAGLGTDAARSLSSQVSGDIQWTPEAIKSTARTNRALSTGADMLNRGMTTAIKNANNNPIAGRDFQNKWSTQEQLLPTLQFIDSMRNAKADPEGAKKMIDSLGGYGSQGYKDMLKRAGGLNDLITKGQ